MLKDKCILFWTYWSIFALQNTCAFQRNHILLCYTHQLCSQESKHYYIMYYNCIQRYQYIIVLYTTIAFKESNYCCIAKWDLRKKYYWDMNYIQVKKMNQIYYVLILFQKLHCEHVESFHVQGTKSHKLILGQSKYTPLSTGQCKNH